MNTMWSLPAQDYYVDSIKREISLLKGVTFVDVQENTGWNFDHYTQLPIMSFRVLVKGGEKKKIAEVIYKNKPIGVLTVGNTSVKVYDTQGFLHNINFERVE